MIRGRTKNFFLSRITGFSLNQMLGCFLRNVTWLSNMPIGRCCRKESAEAATLPPAQPQSLKALLTLGAVTVSDDVFSASLHNMILILI